jgi:hypothetical protein
LIWPGDPKYDFAGRTTHVKQRHQRTCSSRSIFLTPVCAALALAACGKAADPPPGGGGTGGAAPAPATTPDAARAPDVMPDTGPPVPAGLPPSPGQADLAAFLAAGEYRNAPWLSETSGPRPRAGATSPHEMVRVWMNPQLIASLREGRDGFKDTATGMVHPPHDRWSMAVKELYAEGGTLEGLAAMIKTDEGPSLNSWVYYCYGPDGRCLTTRPAPREMPAYGRGSAVACGFCHGGLVYTKAP